MTEAPLSPADKERQRHEREMVRLAIVNHAAGMARRENREVKVTICQGTPYCSRVGDDAANGCNFCEVVTLRPDGSSTVYDPAHR